MPENKLTFTYARLLFVFESNYRRKEPPVLVNAPAKPTRLAAVVVAVPSIFKRVNAPRAAILFRKCVDTTGELRRREDEPTEPVV